MSATYLFTSTEYVLTERHVDKPDPFLLAAYNAYRDSIKTVN
jgi:hypothetical protein